MNNLKSAFWFLVAGALFMLGCRGIEWLIAKPEVRVLVCVIEEGDSYNNCQYMSELLAKADK